ncbi:MAG: flippase activity-associated protein Agl23 [bacterium]
MVLFAIILCIGLAYRLPKLKQRPMHTDEAVHAMKFGALLERNEYRYDPKEYHGPTLNYLTLLPAKIASVRKITEATETTLRIVPVCAGMLLILLLFFMADGLGRRIVLWAGLFTAVSPAFVYYSRYYIQEMLLVSFTFGAIVSGYRYLKGKNILWAVCTGFFLGLMHATKETCIIPIGAMVLSFLILRFLQSRTKQTLPPIHFRHLFIVLLTACIISASFYTSFFTNLRGIPDSILTYKTYFQKAGQNDWHIHPWFYYFKLLIGSKQSGRPLWTEAFILVLSVVGIVAIIKRRQHSDADSNLLRFLALYAIIMAIVYSIIPYKTPWTMLGFYHTMIIMAAAGVSRLLTIHTARWTRIIILTIVIVGLSHLAYQSYLSNFKYEADASNPVVYAHTTKDIFTIAEKVTKISEVHPDGKNMCIQVICPGHDYWPLPWYFRSFPNVGWWSEVDSTFQPAPVVLASPGIERDLIEKLYESQPPGEKSLYVPLFESVVELRPQVKIRGYVIILNAE